MKVIGHFTARSLHSLKPSVTSQHKLSNMSVVHSLTNLVFLKIVINSESYSSPMLTDICHN